jgi:hypothetical protein
MSDLELSGKVIIENSGKEKTIKVYPYQENWKTNLIRIWLILWTACGAIVLWELFSPISKEQKLFMAIYIVFWLYFELKMFAVIRWRTSGLECLKLTESKLVLEKTIQGKGFPIELSLNEIKKVHIPEVSAVSFAAVFNNSYWLEGQETIVIETDKKKYGFGFQLKKSDAEKILKEISKQLQKKR